MHRVALILAAIAIMADAWATRRNVLAYGERNAVRGFFIRILGLNGGTLGVGVVLAGGFVALGWGWPDSPVTVVSVLFVIVAFGWVAQSNYRKSIPK